MFAGVVADIRRDVSRRISLGCWLGVLRKAELKPIYFIPQPSPNNDLFRSDTQQQLAPATRDPHTRLHDCTSDKCSGA